MTLSRLATALALSAAMTVAANAQDKVVHVYNWSDYIGENVLDEFTKATGIKVVYDVFDSNDILETKLLAGGTGYDVVVPSATFLSRQIQAGVFQPLDKSKLPNLQYQWDEISNQLAKKYDPGNKYAVNYMWGTTGIGYNVGKIKERMPDAPVDSWAMVFDPDVISKFADCGVHMLDAADEILPAALNYLGKDPDSKDPKELEEAAQLVEKVRPYVQKFHSSEYIEALANGNICLAVGWSGDVLQARDRAAEAGGDTEIAYVIPKEGAGMWFDNFAIPADAPHPDEAYAFINFMIDPKIAAENSNYVYYANGNKGSQEFLNEDVIGDTAIYPDEETMKRLFTLTPYDPKVQRVVTRLWTKIKSGT